MAATQEKQIRNIWMLSREYGHLAGAGGVKDVASQLAENLARWTGRCVCVVLPLYGFMDAGVLDLHPLPDPLCPEKPLRLPIAMHLPDSEVDEEVGYFYQKLNGVNVYLVDAERFSQKSAVYSYTEKDESRLAWQKESTGHHDYFAMNVLLQKAALELMISLGNRPDVIHCHDGHTAIVPALIRETPGYRGYFRGTGCLVTIHNAGSGYHQEVGDIAYARSITGLPQQVIDGNQLDGKFDPFLVAGRYAMLNTVSENYARELQETENDRLTGWLGHELKSRDVVLEGVTNGIDPVCFSPAILAASDPALLFDPGDDTDDLSGKTRCKAALLADLADPAGETQFEEVERFGTLQNRVDYPLFTFIGRLSEQKGVDILLEVLAVLLDQEPHVQMLALGSGDIGFESRLIALTDNAQLRGRMCFFKGFSPTLANRIYAAGDFFIVPSRYEPCGLTDFIAQLFGNIPVVHRVGGLVKVKDAVTGLSYRGETPGALLAALHRALLIFDDAPVKRRMQQQAVTEIGRKYAWTKVMQRYLELYQEASYKQTCL